MLLAWVGPLLPCAAAVLFWGSMMVPYRPPAGAEERRLQKQEWHRALAATGAAGVMGGLLSVVSLCGIRNSRGAVVIVPGAVLGIIAAVIVVAVVVLLYCLSGIRL